MKRNALKKINIFLTALFICDFIFHFSYGINLSIISSISASIDSMILILGNILLINYMILTIFTSIMGFYSNLDKVVLYGIIGVIFRLSSIALFFIIPLIFDINVLRFILFSLFLYSLIPIFILITLIYLLKSKSSEGFQEESVIRKFILKISKNNSDFKLVEVGKKCNTDNSTALRIVRKMIEEGEIYADYFKKNKKFAFNIKANLEEIDKLMEIYRKWEQQYIGKSN